MSSSTILTVICFVLATVVICNSVDVKGGGSTNLVALGTVDGKTFFGDNIYRNWTVSRTFCSDMGMQLAAITSKAQWDILISAYNTTNFAGTYWTSARDSYERRQLTWDRLGSQPSETFGKWRSGLGENYQTCAAFVPNPGYTEMVLLPCSAHYRVLCETMP